jgi:TPR repeat protein
MFHRLLLWLLISLPLAAQFQDWPPMPDAARLKLVTGNFTVLLNELKSEAARGDVAAMFYLGRAYEEMTSIPHDYDEAIRWYRLAAESGSGPSAWSLGRLYEGGGERT